MLNLQYNIQPLAYPCDSSHTACAALESATQLSVQSQQTPNSPLVPRSTRPVEYSTYATVDWLALLSTRGIKSLDFALIKVNEVPHSPRMKLKERVKQKQKYDDKVRIPVGTGGASKNCCWNGPFQYNVAGPSHYGRWGFPGWLNKTTNQPPPLNILSK